MNPLLAEGPLLWFLNRGTGLVLLVVLSLSVALGVLALGGRVAGDGGGRLPRFVTQALHRNLALGGLLLLVAHIATAVADEYVDIRWWHAVVPWGADHEAVWTGLGTLSFDLMIAVILTTAVRSRLRHRTWKAVHLLAWAAWLLGVAHGVMIGTDLRDPASWRTWSLAPTLVAIGIVVLAAAHRVLARPAPQGTGASPRAAGAPARPRVVAR